MDRVTPTEQVARLYEEAEAQAAKAGEQLVGSGGFASVLGQLAENAAAMTKLTGDVMDAIWRNLRVAGRRDVVRLARQLARTEDKLERLLQEIETLRDELATGGGRPAGRPPDRPSAQKPEGPPGSQAPRRSRTARKS